MRPPLATISPAVRHAGGQRDAIFSAPGQPGKAAAHGAQRWPGRKNKGCKYRRPVHPPYEGDEYLDYDNVMELLDFYRPWLARMYCNTMNIIHYMHDKYAYEKTQMALHDTKVHRYMAFGIAGMSVFADSSPPSNTPVSAASGIRKQASSPTSRRWGIIPPLATTTTVWIPSPGSRWSYFIVNCKNASLPGRGAYPFHPDHHLQCGFTAKDRLHPRWPQGRRTLCSWR